MGVYQQHCVHIILMSPLYNECLVSLPSESYCSADVKDSDWMDIVNENNKQKERRVCSAAVLVVLNFLICAFQKSILTSYYLCVRVDFPFEILIDQRSKILRAFRSKCSSPIDLFFPCTVSALLKGLC